MLAGPSPAEPQSLTPRGGVSVVVATHRRPRELHACLRSLLAQSRPAEQIVVVDDAAGADPATRSAVVDADGGRGRVVYVAGTRGGLAAAHNRGLLEVQTPLVAFTDDDVVADDHWLARIVDGFASGTRVACVTGAILPLELETQAQRWLEAYAGFGKGAERRTFELPGGAPRDPLFPFAAGRLGSGANMAFATAALREMGGFDPALGAGTRARGGDDLAAFFEVIQRGHALVYEPAAIVHHRHAPEYSALRAQVLGYGVGLTAYLTKCLLDRPRLALTAARMLPRALHHGLARRSAKNARLPDGYPRELVRRERQGMLLGPLAYVASRRRARRAAT